MKNDLSLKKKQEKCDQTTHLKKSLHVHNVIPHFFIRRNVVIYKGITQ